MGEKNIWERSDSYSLPESSFGIYREKISK